MMSWTLPIKVGNTYAATEWILSPLCYPINLSKKNLCYPIWCLTRFLQVKLVQNITLKYLNEVHYEIQYYPISIFSFFPALEAACFYAVTLVFKLGIRIGSADLMWIGQDNKGFSQIELIWIGIDRVLKRGCNYLLYTFFDFTLQKFFKEVNSNVVKHQKEKNLGNLNSIENDNIIWDELQMLNFTPIVSEKK